MDIVLLLKMDAASSKEKRKTNRRIVIENIATLMYAFQSMIDALPEDCSPAIRASIQKRSLVVAGIRVPQRTLA